MALCIITHSEYERWQETGKRPNCDFHKHISPTKARTMEKNDEALMLQEQRAIIIYNSVKQYEWSGKRSGNYQVMQMTLPK
jgi:hypothetical protein